MAVVVRRTKLVNPAHRRRHNRRNRRLSLAQRLAGFGGKRSQSAAMSHRRRNAGPHSIRHTKRAISRLSGGRPAAKDWARRYRALLKSRRPRSNRRNVSAIVTAGLPFANPRHHTKRRKHSMATVRRNRRRAHARTHHRRRTALGRFARSNRRHNRYRMNARRRHHRRHNRRMNAYRHNRRRNVTMLSTRGIIGGLEKGAYIAGGAVGSRFLTQMVLGAGNTGFLGYAGNALAGGLLSVVGEAVRKGSGEFLMYGTFAGIVLRIIQDQTPLGKYFNLSGVDSGMGAIIPQNLPMPSIYTGTNAMVRVPTGWGGAVPAVAPATAAGAAGQVVRGGMGAPVGRGLYSTGGGRGLYRPA